MDQIRQGDVLLIETSKIHGKEEKTQGKVVLALGEVTGHHHRFEDAGVKLFRHDDGGATIAIDKPASLIHEEHGAIVLQPGIYRQGYQVEYTPKELRRVAD